VPRVCPELKMTAMPMVDFLRYLGTACVQQNISMVELAGVMAVGRCRPHHPAWQSDPD
jgi:hypothetical protein